MHLIEELAKEGQNTTRQDKTRQEGTLEICVMENGTDCCFFMFTLFIMVMIMLFLHVCVSL